MLAPASFSLFFFFNDTATTEIYTLSLHDALPIFPSAPSSRTPGFHWPPRGGRAERDVAAGAGFAANRSEEHTSELQSQSNLVCRLLLEKKNKKCVQEHIRVTNDLHMELHSLVSSS